MRLWKRRNGQLDVKPDANAARDELLSAFLDNELSPAEAQALLAGLDDDLELRDALEGLRDAKSALGALGEVRAPRSFALAAPPVPAAPLLSRFEIGARIGALVAGVTFVVVLGSDLRGGASESTTERIAYSTGSDAAAHKRGAEESLASAPTNADQSGGGSAGSRSRAPSSAPGAIPTSMVEPALEGESTDAALPHTDGTRTTMLAPQTDFPRRGASSGSTTSVEPQPLAEGTQPSATEDTTAQRLNDPLADVATPEDRAGAQDTPAVAPAPADAPAARPASRGVVPGGRGGDSEAGLTAGASSAPGSGAGTPQPMPSEWRVSVERSTGFDELRAAEIGLAVAAVVLGGSAGWLWYRRRRAAGVG